jgi:hypothetical protein
MESPAGIPPSPDIPRMTRDRDECQHSAGVRCDQGPASCPSVLKRAFCSLLSVA